jgi:hemerythrin superfamily protein
MSKFDEVVKRIEEALPVQPQQQNVQQQQQPVKNNLNPTQQQNVEKLADQLAKINDPAKIKELLATIMQGVTHPQNGVTPQTNVQG